MKKDSDIWEQEGLKELANLGELGAYSILVLESNGYTMIKALDTLWNSEMLLGKFGKIKSYKCIKLFGKIKKY